MKSIYFIIDRFKREFFRKSIILQQFETKFVDSKFTGLLIL